MKLGYKRKLTGSFVIIFSLFTTGIVLLERSQEKDYKTKILEERLDTYADIVNRAIVLQAAQSYGLDSLKGLLPYNLRLTWIHNEGNILYDNTIDNVSDMENHRMRPEIIEARTKNSGSDIRVSSSNEKAYLYYAKKFNGYYVRVALPYDIHIQSFLQSEPMYLYYILLLFSVTLLIINFTAGRLSRMIRRLKKLTDSAEDKTIDIHSVNFPNDELGAIGVKIVQNFNRLKESEKKIILEREKLLQHVHSSEEGLCFFSAAKKVEFYNGLFIQYLNILADDAQSNPSVIFKEPLFEKTVSFLSDTEKQTHYFETKIEKQGRTFIIRANIFDDGSFEIILNDITKQEKTRLLKQEMTGNITHELRTPVTGIRGCLETVLKYELERTQEKYFIQQAYNQTVNLSELIQDMSLISKMEAAPRFFKMEQVAIKELLEELKNDLDIPLREKAIDMVWNITGEIIIKGNRNLLYSIFRNLTDNVIRYAGTNIRIEINQYAEDKGFYYFSYSDTGAGIPEEQHLSRLFERFYRINEGRTRNTGGSGLGLSIVKNAVSLHKGTIVAKNRTNGGLEFLFSLQK
ncbi:MAG: HAMP domain-containing histidine kinase [Tannerella sp.]|nr:HAMP domain-containing histidine kinase [Tannerella sp.]